jgi:D-alanine-D-alanine ligase-like ATP-grasp enzyme
LSPPARLGRRRLRVVQRRVDLVRSLGIRHGFRRWRSNRRHAQRWGDRQLAVTRGLWTEAASHLGAEIRELSLSNKLAPPVFEFRLGDAKTRVLGQLTPFVERPSTAVASDKPLAYQLLTEAGIPVPEHVVVDARDFATARAFLERGPVPCLVKPAGGRGGEGVIGSIRTLAQLRRAVLHASADSPMLLIERQLDGDQFRVVVLQGEILVVLRRVRPRVTGDGEASVAELIWREYEARLALEGAGGLKPFRIGPDCLHTLEEQGLNLRSVPPSGTSVTVMTATNFGGSGDSEVIAGPLSEALQTEVLKAVDVLGVRLAGVDLITSDTSRALTESAGAILDVGPAPALHNLGDASTTMTVLLRILRSLLADPHATGRAADGSGRPAA